jgi:glycosyltransferase involved in cell wall biosynthesis
MDMKRKKIGVIGLKGLPAFVGAGTVGENIINQLKDDFDFYVYSITSHTKLKSGDYNGVYQKVMRAIPFNKLNGFWYYFISALHARFFGDFDLIHVHNSFAAFTLYFLKGKYKVILTTHGAYSIVDKWKRYAWFWKYNTNKLLRKADYLCCVSKYEQRRFKQELNLEAHYIPNGINPVDVSELPEINENYPYIFFGAGRIIRTKGLHDLLSALHKMNYRGKLLVAGDMEQIKAYGEEIREMIGDLDVQFLGLIKEKEMLLSYMAKSTLMVYPSYIEAMPMMLLEAITVECPVICSDIIPHKDILSEEEALLFKCGNAEDLADKIRWALSNLDEMKVKAQNSRSKFINEYNWVTIAKQYKEIYLKYLN